MSEEPLQVAVIGLGGFGRQALEAIACSESVQLVGVADREQFAAEQAASIGGAPAYSDYRSCLAETRPAAVCLDVSPKAACELIPACAQRGVHVWKSVPLARNLEDAVLMVRTMSDASLKLTVGTRRRFDDCYCRAWKMRQRVGEAFLARAHYLFNWGPELGWRGDKESAGGGALLELGYHPADLLVWMLGLPEEVYGFSASISTPPDDNQLQAVYDTDDTAAAILRFASGCMASVVTTRRSGPMSEALCLHGLDGSMEVSADSCLVRDPDGNVIDRTECSSPPLEASVRQLEAFVQSVRDEADTYPCSGWENLLTMAVMEAIYLSDRTGQPESPARLLESHNLKLEDCMQCTRPDAEETPKGESPDVTDE
ncbi:MAG: Gfo/Idh/MocA family oxidoreductase [Phycisphaerae bacterium]|jgi:predicted dehydrogenase|nr:Gfo/Idh/MocA family oxidoreductase [Phycisphaerae bacterium]